MFKAYDETKHVSCITFDNSCTREVEYRIGQSWKTFGAHRDMLVNKKASLKKRLALLDIVVLPSISWMDNNRKTSRPNLDNTASNDTPDGWAEAGEGKDGKRLSI